MHTLLRTQRLTPYVQSIELQRDPNKLERFPCQVAKHQNTMQIKLEKYSSVHTESFITLKKIK